MKHFRRPLTLSDRTIIEVRLRDVWDEVRLRVLCFVLPARYLMRSTGMAARCSIVQTWLMSRPVRLVASLAAWYLGTGTVTSPRCTRCQCDRHAR